MFTTFLFCWWQKCKILLTEDAAGAIKAHVGADYQQLGRGFTTWDDLLLQFTATTKLTQSMQTLQ